MIWNRDYQERILSFLIASIIFCISVACSAGEVNSLRVRGKMIRIGDTEGKVSKILIKNMVDQIEEADPNNPDNLVVQNNYQIKKKRFTIYFGRQNDQGPYKVTKIITE